MGKTIINMDTISENQIDTFSFYREYHGHKLSDLKILHYSLKNLKKDQKFIYFCGDSTLDNKYWFNDTAPAVNGYEKVLTVPRSKCDVAYWVNKYAEQNETQNFVCINTSIEESTLSSRIGKPLSKPQDRFIRDNITENDVLVVSVGGNDVALKPSIKTIFNTLSVLTQSFITSETSQKLGTGHFINLFGAKTQEYIEKLLVKTKPKLVIVCMLYFLDENENAQSWAGMTLKALRYNSKPGILQSLIRQVYENGTKSVKIDGTKVVYLPFFEVLDGKDTNDYVARVEPSAKGGEKMGKAIIEKVLKEYPT